MRWQAPQSFAREPIAGMREDFFWSFRQVGAEESLQTREVDFFSGFNRIGMAAGEFPKHLWGIRGRKVFLGMLEANGPVFWTVGNQDRHVDAGELAVGVVLNAGHATDGQPGKHFAADIRNGRKSVLQDETANVFAQRELRSDAAPERFSKSNNFGAGKALLGQPGKSGLSIQISAFLAGFAGALAVAPVIKGEDVDAEFVPGLVEGAAVANVACIAMHDEQGEGPP